MSVSASFQRARKVFVNDLRPGDGKHGDLNRSQRKLGARWSSIRTPFAHSIRTLDNGSGTIENACASERGLQSPTLGSHSGLVRFSRSTWEDKNKNNEDA